MTQTNEWKSRYEASVRSLGQRETAWQETETLLRRGIRRLAIAGRGRDAELDVILADIQRLAQSKRNAELDQAMNRMAQRVIRLNEGADRDAAGAAGLLSVSIIDLVRLLNIDEAQKQRLAAEVDERGKLDQESLKRLAASINSMLDPDPAGQPPDDSIETIMMTLVGRLSTLQGFGAGNIRARIVERVGRGEWRSAIDETIESVAGLLRTLDSEKHDLEKFIVGLTGELGAISRAIDADNADTADNQRDTEALNDLVRDGVATLEQDLSQAKDIDFVKSSIASNISQIRGGVGEFVGQLQQRYQASNARNRELSERMNQMESETEALRGQLDENRQQLMTDALTGASSRLAYDQNLARAFDDWRESKAGFAYAILDIDHFKRVNDTYGHSAGDRALQLIARIIRETVDDGVGLYRLGGEEFVLLFPRAGIADADAVVDRVRGAIGETPFHFKKTQLRLSLSAGITEVGETDDVETIYQRADRALYRAKETGRDRQVIAEAAG